MANIYTNIEKNKWKTAFLMLGFTAFVMLVAYLIASYLNNESILYFAGLGALFANAGSFWFSDKIALSSAGARPADEKQYKELHRIVENLAITAGLPKPRVYIIDDAAPNAFATGRDPKHAAIAVTSGLIETLEKPELEAVIAHELSHIGNRDILIMSVAVVLLGFLAMLTDMAMRMAAFSGSDRESKNPITLWLWIIVIILAPIIAQLMQLAISRRREFQADSSAVLLTRYPEALASALRKISNYKMPMKRASAATAHLFISNPFGDGPGSRLGSKIANLFSTHPPVEERIKAIMSVSR